MSLVRALRRMPMLAAATRPLLPSLSTLGTTGIDELRISRPPPLSLDPEPSLLEPTLHHNRQDEIDRILREGQSRYGVLRGTSKVQLSSMLKNLKPKIDGRSQLVFNKWANHPGNNGDRDCPFFFVKKDGQLAGFAILHHTEATMLVPNHLKPYVLDLVYVAQRWRREGIAVDLIHEALRHYQVHSYCDDDLTTMVLSKAGLKRQDIEYHENIIMAYP